MRLSEHFTLREFDCHDGRRVPVELIPNIARLVDEALGPIRVKWAGPIIVISGWRSPEWNRRVGGAVSSTHPTGEGADVRPLHVETLPQFIADIEELYQTGRLPGLGGFGIYPGQWVHLDIRKAPDGHLRRWYGSGMGSEPRS